MATVHHKIRYTADHVPLEQVIEALKAHQKLLPESIEVLQNVAPGSVLRLAGVTVGSVETGSLVIDLLLEIYGNYQKSIEGTVISGIEEILGVDVPPEYETLVTLATFAVVYFVSRAAYDAVRKKKKEPAVEPPHIKGDYNTVITIIADRLQVGTGDVDRAVSSIVHPSKFRQLVKPVADFLRPAKQQPGTEIEGAGTAISPEAIREFPSDADLGQLAQTEIMDAADVLINIRQLNKDSGKTGWAAKVANHHVIPDRRLPMDLYPTVDAEALAKHEAVRADLVVEMARDAKGDLAPRRLHLLAYRPLGG